MKQPTEAIMSSALDAGAQKPLYTLIPLNADAEAAVSLKQNRHFVTLSDNHKLTIVVGLDNLRLDHGLKVTLGSDPDNSILVRGAAVAGKHCVIAIEPLSGELYVEHLRGTADESAVTKVHGQSLSSGYLSRHTLSGYRHGISLFIGSCWFLIHIYKSRLTNEDIDYLRTTYRVKLDSEYIPGKPAVNDLGKYDRAHDDLVLAEIGSTLSGKTWIQKVDVFLDGRHQTVACKRIPFGGQKDVIMQEVKIMSALDHVSQSFPVPKHHNNECRKSSYEAVSKLTLSAQPCPSPPPLRLPRFTRPLSPLVPLPRSPTLASLHHPQPSPHPLPSPPIPLRPHQIGRAHV